MNIQLRSTIRNESTDKRSEHKFSLGLTTVLNNILSNFIMNMLKVYRITIVAFCCELLQQQIQSLRSKVPKKGMLFRKSLSKQENDLLLN